MDGHNNTDRQDGNLINLNQEKKATSESDRKYRELVEHANSAIIRINTDFSILFVNEYALNFFGYEAETLIGGNLLELLVPAEDEGGTPQHEVFHRAAGAPEIYGSCDQQNRCRDGRLVWVHWVVRALRDARGDVRELLCVGMDISKRKEAELKAERYQRRARRLASQLVESEERERSLIATYLHDNIIQNLSLASIRMGQMLDEVSDAKRPFVKQQMASVRMLIEDAVVECRSIMDRLAPALLDELGLSAALDHMVEKQQETKDNITIEVHDRLKDESLPAELAHLLFRTVRELFMNALKYAGASRIEISVWKEVDHFAARVEDDGCGFDPADVEATHYDEAGGFGLFAIRERLEGLSGKLEVESGPGQGTVATIKVPHRLKGASTQLPG